MLTIAELRSGDPAASSLAGELLDDILHELLLDASRNALDALSGDILARIVAYLDAPEP
ncbi:MAG TPA: hypothetical protein VNF04_08185 [Stellaceae bacterium]|nr:hypothetical protein [Stellaceae bacterium]